MNAPRCWSKTGRGAWRRGGFNHEKKKSKEDPQTGQSEQRGENREEKEWSGVGMKEDSEGADRNGNPKRVRAK